jgi:hypothetical protein
MREYLFCAKSGFYVIDKPRDFEWGRGELDPRQFMLVRTVKAETLRLFRESQADLVDRRLRLKQPIHYSGMKNIWLGGVLEKTPERDWTPAPEYVVLRTGRRCKTEEELWGCVVEGDRAFHTSNPQDPEARGLLLTITSVEPRKFELKRDVTLKEAECPVC